MGIWYYVKLDFKSLGLSDTESHELTFIAIVALLELILKCLILIIFVWSCDWEFHEIILFFFFVRQELWFTNQPLCADNTHCNL